MHIQNFLRGAVKHKSKFSRITFKGIYTLPIYIRIICVNIDITKRYKIYIINITIILRYYLFY